MQINSRRIAAAIVMLAFVFFNVFASLAHTEVPQPFSSFKKKAVLKCDHIEYSIHIEDMAGPTIVPITVSDNWPIGTLPATSINFTGSPTVSPTKVLTTTGWSLTFLTPNTITLGAYDITWSSPIDPTKFVGGHMTVTNTAHASSPSWPNYDPENGDSTFTIEVNEQDYKSCTHQTGDGTGTGTPTNQTSCLKATPDVSCGPTKGTYTITLHPQGVNGVIPSVLQVSTTTPGISLVPANASILVTGGVAHVTVVGATPGQAISLDIAGTAIGQGSSDGIDQCCNGKVEIVIPKDLDCDKDKVDIAIHKDGATSPPRHVPWYSFDLKMTNEGKAFTAANGQLTVTEHVPAGMKFTVIAPSAGWTCLPAAPVTGPANLICTYAGGPIAAGPNATIGTIKITAQNLNPAPYADVENCADVGLAAGASAVETNLGNNKSCVVVSKKPPVIKVEKTCDPAIKGPGDLVAPKWEAACHIKITTTGSVSGPLNISEVFGPSGTVSYTGSSTSDPWACAPVTATAPAPMNCTLPGNTLNPVSDVTIIDVKVVFPNSGAITESKNCATPKYAGQVGQKSCVPFTKDDSTIHVTKTCEPASWHKYPVSAVATGIGFVSNCHITITTTGPQTGTVSVNDVLNGTGTLVSVNSTSTPAWNCTSPTCTINGGSLNQTSSTSTFNATVVFATSGNALEAKNCAKIAVNQSDAGKSCVKFTVDEVKPKLEIVKTGLKECQAGVPCPFTISITSIGQPYSGNILLSDVLTPNLAWPVTSITPNICGAAITAMPFNCVANVNLAANTPLTFTVTLNPLTTNALSQNENCISAAFVGSTVPLGPMSTADAQALATSNQLSTPVQSCWKFTEPPKGDSSISVNKVCDPATEVVGAINHFEAKCHITVTTTGPVSGNIKFSDDVTGGNISSNGMSSTTTPAWGCYFATCSIDGSQLNQSSSVSIFDVKVTLANFIDPATWKNCADLYAGATAVGQSCVPIVKKTDPPNGSPPTITKLCDEAQPSKGAQGMDTVCHITVNMNGSATTPVNVVETLSSAGGKGTITNISSPQNWICMPTPIVPSATPVNCNISAADFNSGGTTSTIDVSVHLSDPMAVLEGVRNCAKLDSGAVPMPESCADIKAGNNGQPNLTINKFGPKNCKPGQPCDFTINITNNGAAWNGNVLLFDKITPNAWPVTAITPNVCGTAVGTTPFYCVANLNLAANQSMQFNVTLQASSVGPISNENCIDMAIAPNGAVSGQTYMPAQIQAMYGTTIPTGTRSCWKFSSEDIQPPSKFSVTKTCLPVVANPGQTPVYVKCTIKVSAIGSPLPFIIKVIENLISPVADPTKAQITSLSSSEPWAFPAIPANSNHDQPMSITGAALTAAGGNSSIDVMIKLPEFNLAGESQNCVIAQAEDVDGSAVATTQRVCVKIDAKERQPLPLPSVPGPVLKPLKCDSATATAAGEVCRCRFSNMSPVSKTECQCNKGFKLDAGQGCVKIVVRPACQPPQVYNPATNTCITPRPVCRDPQVYDANSNRCVTPRPRCAAPQVYNPATNSCITPRPICKKPQVYDANSNRCITPRPVCRPPQVYNPKRNTCVDVKRECPQGTINVRGNCIPIPRCKFPQIPVPGTGLCVNLGGGPRPPKGEDVPGRPPRGGVQLPGLDIPGL